MSVKKNSKKLRKQNSVPLTNPMSGVFDWGGLSDVAAASQPWEMQNSNSYSLISMQRIMLTYAYVMHGPLRTLVDQPVYDALRGGVKIKTDEVSPEELEDLHRFLKSVKFYQVLTDALRWDRLYGGAGVIVNVEQDPTKPLDIKTIPQDSKIEFRVADRWELTWNGVPDKQGSTFSFYGEKIHPSRIARIVGERAPSLAAQRLQGWGMSVIECVIREMNSYFKEHNVIFELLDEAKVDVWKIKNFNANILAQAAAAKTAKRLQIATQMKNFLNAVTLDAEDDYQQKTLTFSGLSDIMEQIRIGIAAAVRMPMAKIFGLAAKGFNSGEDDIENYNAIVEAQRERVIDVLDTIIPVVCMIKWGFVPSDLNYEFKPLRVLSAEQEENVKTAKFNRYSQLYSQGILTPKEYCEVLKQDAILTIETEVSKGAEPMPPINPFMDQAGETGGDGGSKSTDGKKASDGDEAKEGKE